ncbi:hypothetical protein JHL17_22260 [Azospirillum sp. YIM B02556]|uniref:Uncharacterized protein n=1 Tax=Azospirillum endophyticum TaxID=2800326 RepID=A0ABS1F9P0_9PROT|nr:DUF6683 family protein [Azospirillum endophyticum]MBK1840134.1 hypothetical protein [Azospirillum endophyticum]
MHLARLFTPVLLMLALPWAAPAAAQDMPTVLPNNYVMSDILNRQRVDSAIKSGRGGKTQSAQQPARPTDPAAATTYRASPAVSVRVRRQFADWMGKQAGEEGGRRIAEAMARHDPVASWAEIVAGDGLRPGDMADSMASYWILNWAMANGADNNRAQAQAVRDQIRPTIASNPGYVRLDEAQRQELSEVLMLNFLIQHAAYMDAMKRGDSATARRLGDAAVARFRTEMGVDLRRLKLTEAGFAPAG